MKMLRDTTGHLNCLLRLRMPMNASSEICLFRSAYMPFQSAESLKINKAAS